jgi:hypothetical protein
VEQSGDQLEIMAGRAHDRRDRRAARAQLERCFEHHAIAIRAAIRA